MKRSDGQCDINMSMPLQVSTFTATTPELVTTTHILAELHHDITLEDTSRQMKWRKKICKILTSWCPVVGVARLAHGAPWWREKVSFERRQRKLIGNWWPESKSNIQDRNWSPCASKRRHRVRMDVRTASCQDAGADTAGRSAKRRVAHE